MSFRMLNRATVLRRSTLAVALTMGLTGVAFAQSTTGNIFGQAESGETVTVTGSTGVTRSATVDASGRYRISNLPLGTYSVVLQKDGATVDSRKDVSITVNAGTEVSFAAAANAQALASVTVTANALPAIDVSSVDSRTVITSQDLDRLPLGRSAEAIALLAPGVVQGSDYFAGQKAGSNVVSFGGSSVTENAYYINGYNTTDPLSSLGGIGLPYGAIDQQEIYTGGYSAMYGRSDGGVISQVGKRGTNDWHFGGQVMWSPKFLAEDPKSLQFPNQSLPNGDEYSDSSLPGTSYRNRKNNVKWNTTYDFYAGGPLIKDKLFFFVAAEAEKQEGKSTSSAYVAQPNNTYYTYDIPKYYAKIDWNINDSNILELTGVSNKTEYSGSQYVYDYSDNTEGKFLGHDTSTKTGSDIYVAKYTSYITDSLTFSATYGQNRAIDYSEVPGSDPSLVYLSGATNQDPAITGGTPIRNNNTITYVKNPNAKNKTHGLRLDLEYKLGDHTLAAGIDNMHFQATDEGQQTSGPGYWWRYFHATDATAPVVPGLGVGAPGGNGYYVSRYIFSTTTSMSVDQKAQYIEDRWQISDKFLLNMGLRDDQFTNYNAVGKAYVDNKNQWAPRLGFSWDVFGDSTFKVFGNLGRYYLALPNSVAIRGASPSTYTNEYFTYTGIDANGNPTGLTPMGPGPVSTNGEYGVAPDAKTVTASNLKSQYQDEAILGFSKMLGTEWVFGAKGTLRKLQTAIDDVCDTDPLVNKAIAQGIDPDSVTLPSSCLIFNPGETNSFLLAKVDGSGYEKVSMTTKDWGFASGAKRKYYALDLFLEHPFDGKWQARVDYTFSRSYGNTEGQVLSTVGQDDVSKTQDWDSAPLMVNSNGVLSNDRTHQLKAYGSYVISPEWMVSGALRVMSGAPKACLGYYGPDETDPTPGYGSAYRWCGGKPSTLGTNGHLPWQKIVDLGVTYRPAFADNKLAFSFNIFNVFNERKPTVLDATYEDSSHTVSNTYGATLYQTTPRYGRFAVSYDF